MFFSEKNKLSDKGMFVFEYNALGIKHIHYYNSLVSAEWEPTTLKYSHSTDSQRLRPKDFQEGKKS